jgi:hypothetical protein
VVRKSSLDGSEVAEPFPPLPVAIDLRRRRQTTAESIYIDDASLDVSVLLDLRPT